MAGQGSAQFVQPQNVSVSQVGMPPVGTLPGEALTPPPGGSALAQANAGTLPPNTIPPGAMMLRRGAGGSALAQTAAIPNRGEQYSLPLAGGAGQTSATPVSPSPDQTQGNMLQGDQLPLDLPMPITAPGGTETMGGEATAQQIPTMSGKAKLKRGKKVMQVEGMPLAAAEPEIDATVTQTDEAPMQGDLAPAGEEATVVSVKMRRDTNGAPEHVVTMSDGRTATMYKSDAAGDMGLGAWHLLHSAVYGVAPSQPGYVSDVLGYTKKEALENVVKVLDRMDAQLAARTASRQ
jgi:hypothetical protein